MYIYTQYKFSSWEVCSDDVASFTLFAHTKSAQRALTSFHFNYYKSNTTIHRYSHYRVSQTLGYAT